MKHYKERPCPGCGEVDQRPPQRLCPRCHKLLKLGKAREQEIAKFEITEEKTRVAIGTPFHDGTDAFLGFLPISDTNVLRALVRLGGLESARGSGGSYKESRLIYYPGVRPGYYDAHPAQYVWATPGQADNIELVLDYIKMAIGEAYSDGLERGRSIIRRLATAGVKEMNEATIAGGKKK